MRSYLTSLDWRGGKKGFLYPSDWHQRPGRQRQAFRAPGPRLGPHYDKAKDGCQKNRNLSSSSSRLLIEEIHERLAEKTTPIPAWVPLYDTVHMFVATCAWICHLHVYGTITHARAQTDTQMCISVCACPCMCVRLTRCCAPVCREH